MCLKVCVVRLIIAGLMGACATSSSAPGSKSTLEQRLSEQLQRYPKLEAQDLYKLLHQSFFGTGHMVGDREGALAYLKKEVAGMPSSKSATDEPLREPLLGDRFERVHLRPYLTQGGALQALADDFVDAATSPADREGFERAAAQTLDSLRKRGRGALALALEELIRESRGESYPARHHSASYRQAYQPAYRVVKRASEN